MSTGRHIILAAGGTGRHIILAAGGTGGHMMPADALADVLVARGHKVTLITDPRGDRFSDILQSVDRHVLRTSSHMAGGVVGKVKSLASIWSGTREVRRLFADLRPDAVVGFGGYPSMPSVLAARMRGLPIILHEQNAVLGRVNRWMARYASVIALSTASTSRIPKGVPTETVGNPVRQAVLDVASSPTPPEANIPDAEAAELTVFVLGGSQGARILSDVVPAGLSALVGTTGKSVSVFHQARPEDMDRVRRTYEEAGIKADVDSYFMDIPDRLVRSSLVIARSGASTLAELAATGKPSILVPLAIAADDHQSANAAIFKRAGAAWVLPEREFNEITVSGLLEDLLSDPKYLRNAAKAARSCAYPSAANDLADCVLNTIDESVS